MARQNSNKQPIETNLEKLFSSVRSFRSSQYYRDMMNMCAKFRHLSPYNAMLVNMQKPLSRYVLRRDDWSRKYDRHLKPNVQPLIILVPFGPIEYLFEIGDTEPNDTSFLSDNDILESIARPFKTKAQVNDSDLDTLMKKSALHGMAFDLTMNAGAGYGANITLLEHPTINKGVQLTKDCKADLPAPYLISVNKTASKGEKFASIVHELGHFFCHHLPTPGKWNKWVFRKLSHNAEEFEAESVAWLICEHMNIGNPSERYLSSYLNEHDEIPSEVSVEYIMHAFNEIWKLCKGTLNCKKGLLYEHNKYAKDLIDSALPPKKQTPKSATGLTF